MRAILIEWIGTGRRAGDINNKDPMLQCYGWQNMDVTPMLELRVVEDERDLTYLDGVPGVTVLVGKDAINQAIDANFPPQYHIQDEFLYQEHFKQKNNNPETVIDIDTLPDDLQERLKLLKDVHHLKGIAKKNRKHV